MARISLIFILVLVVFIYLPLDLVLGDTIVMESGARFEGRVEGQDEIYILHTPDGGRMTFPKALVKEVVLSDREETADNGLTRPEGDKEPTKKSEVTLFMEIPLVGEFGTDILPEGVEQCLRWCSQDPNIRHIVFRIKSPGGEVEAADAIWEILERYDSRFEYHAMIEQAISASIWVVFSCDTIHMCEGSTVGAAVIYSVSTTGNVDVDAKFNAAIAAKIASLAAKKGHSPVLGRAMVVREAQAYAWMQDGKVVIADSAPMGAPQDIFILADTETSVLSLTRDQAVQVGFAHAMTGKSDALGEHLGFPGWRKGSNYTENVMLRTKLNREKAAAKQKAAVEKNIKRTKATILYIESNAEEAVANDPANFTYYYDASSGLLTPNSMRLWRRQTDLAVGAWRRVQDGIVQLRKLEKEAEGLGLNRIVHDLNLADLYARAGREIARLLAERNKYGV